MIEFSEGSHTYYVYIITNKYRSTYYIGMTNNLGKRLQQHRENIEKGIKTFASRYQIKHLVYYERFSWVQQAIVREKELKGWRRDKKLDLIRSFNSDFEFLEDRFLNN
jgi:putative endonuclease